MEEIIQKELEIQIRKLYKEPLKKGLENKFFIFPFLEILSELYKKNTYIWMNQKLKKKHKKHAISYEALKTLSVNDETTIEYLYKELYDDDFTKHGKNFTSEIAILTKITRSDKWLKEYVYFKSLDTKGTEKPLYKVKDEKIDEVREFVKRFKAENVEKIHALIQKHIHATAPKVKIEPKKPKVTKEAKLKEAKLKKEAGNMEINGFIKKFQLYFDALKPNTNIGDWIYRGDRVRVKARKEYGYGFQNLKNENYFLYLVRTSNTDRHFILYTDPRQHSIISYGLIYNKNFKNENGKITILEAGWMNAGHTRLSCDIQERMQRKGLKDNKITSFNIDNLHNEFNQVLADILKWADYRNQVRADYNKEDAEKEVGGSM